MAGINLIKIHQAPLKTLPNKGQISISINNTNHNNNNSNNNNNNNSNNNDINDNNNNNNNRKYNKDSRSNNSKSSNNNNKNFGNDNSDRSYGECYVQLTTVKLTFYNYEQTKLQCLKFSDHCLIYSKQMVP